MQGGNMRFLAVIFLAGTTMASGEIRDVVKSADIDKMFAQTSESREVLAKTNYALVFRVNSGDTGARKTDPEADEFWFVRKGTAKISLGSGEGSGTRQYSTGAGDVVKVSRTTGYQIAPGPGRFEYVAVRIFATGRRTRIGIGAATEPRPMADVATKAQIHATFAGASKNVLLHSAGALLINHVIYSGAHGPWEVHQTCDDVYFMRIGTARAQLDGTLV